MALRFTLRQLEYFTAVGETGSVAAAAARINVSSPSISAAISSLEAELGVRLFIRRHAHGLALTPAGRQLMVEAQRILSAAGALSAQAAGLGGDLAGPLALGCLKTFAPLVLPELRCSFEKAAPAVRIRQFELDHADLLGRLLGGEIDLGLTYDLAVPPGIAFEPLAVLAPHVMLPAGHPLAARPSLTPEDLGGEAMVLLDLPYSADYFLSLFETAGQRPRIAERTADMGVLRALVANGYGFSLINTRTIQTDAPDGKRLAFVPLASGLRPLQLGLAGVEGAFARRTPSAFRDHCRALVAARGVPGCEPGS